MFMIIFSQDHEHYEASQDVKSQLKFLLELDVLEKKRHQRSEREVLMKAMKVSNGLDNGMYPTLIDVK